MLPVSALMFSILAAATPAPAPRANLVVSPCDVGDRQQFETTTCDIELRNTGDKPIRITNAEAASKWDRIDKEAVVPPRGTTYLKATVDMIDDVGYSKHSFRFATDEPGLNARRGASVTAFVSTVLDQAELKIDFGTVKLAESLPEKSITLSSREVTDFRILGVLSKPDYLDAKIAEDGRTVQVSMNKQAPWGVVRDQVKLKINAPQQAQAWVQVQANVQGEVVPDSNPFPLGLMRTNNKNEFLIRLTSPSGKAFKLGKLGLRGIKGDLAAQPCRPAKEGCQLVQLRIANDQGTGRVGGFVDIELPEFKRTLPIQVEGLLLDPSVKVHDLNEDLEKARSASGKAQSGNVAETSQKLDMGQALKQKVDEATEAPPPGKGPLLRWTVANQTPLHGYIIYRANAEAGPFLRISKELIKVADPEGTSSYQYRDNTAESGKTYWYSIGTVGNDGEKQALGGAQKVVAK